MNDNLRMLDLTGIAAALWMFFGVVIVARMFPGYSHTRQVLSELGAKGRPTAKIHPFINNFPIGLLFSLFGAALYLNHRDSVLMLASAALIFIHGICHLITGLFPCDEDLGQANASRTQIIHNVAGLVMQLTLFGASATWAVSASVEPIWFRWVSGACAFASIFFLVRMFKTISIGARIGLYQRLSYGSLILWTAIFSVILYVRTL